jgi:hypothetical protein
MLRLPAVRVPERRALLRRSGSLHRAEKSRWVDGLLGVVKSELRDFQIIPSHAVNHPVFIRDAP